MAASGRDYKLLDIPTMTNVLRIAICSVDGCVVTDVDAHEDFHQRVEMKATRIGEVMEKFVVVTVDGNGEVHIYGKDRCCSNAACPFPDADTAMEQAKTFPADTTYTVRILPLEGL